MPDRPELNLALKSAGDLARILNRNGVDIADGDAAGAASDVVLINPRPRDPVATDAQADAEAGEVVVPFDVVGLAARRFEIAGDGGGQLHVWGLLKIGEEPDFISRPVRGRVAMCGWRGR